MARIKGRTDWYLLSLLVLVAIYSVATGEWWAIGSLAGAAVFVSLTTPIDRYYGAATAPVERLVLALEHLLALGLLVLFLWLSTRMSDAPTFDKILWIALLAGVVAYFVRAALAWRRFRHEGIPR